VGEVVHKNEVHGFNEYNLKIAEERVHRLFERTIYLAREHHRATYPGIVVNCVGDFISGGLHPELAKSDHATSLKAVNIVLG
jgi:hypothetical protein